MHWTDPWLDLEYEAVGRGPRYDCLGLWIALTRLRFGVEFDDPLCTVRGGMRTSLVRSLRQGFKKVDVAQEGDALVFISSGRPLHIGYALDNTNMIHISETHRSLIERWRGGLMWQGKLEGIYRRV